MIKKTRIHINANIKFYLGVLKSFIFSNNKIKFKEFRDQLQKKLKTNNIVLTSQGRVAAYNIFKVLLNGNKKEIIISPYTLTEVVNAIEYAGGIPKYVDIDLKNGLPDETKLDLIINNDTAGIVITHLFSNDENIIRFKEKYFGKIKIIEDTAINLGAKTLNDRHLGTLFDFGFYSFGVMKGLCTFHGGAIYAKEDKYLKIIKENMEKNIEYPLFKSVKLVLFTFMIDIVYNKYLFNYFSYYLLQFVKKYKISILEKMTYPGVYPKISKTKPKHYNYNFSYFFSNSGLINLDLLDKRQLNRVHNVKFYEKYLNDNLKILKTTNYNINSFLEYPILLKKNLNKEISEKLFNIGYDVRHTWYINSVRVKNLNYKLSEFEASDKLHNYILSLPTNKYFNEEDIKIICNLINKYEK